MPSFDRIVGALGELGPFTVLAERSRIAFHVRMSFAAVVPRRNRLNGHLVLDRRIESPRFTKIEAYSPHNVLHVFRLDSPEQVDEEFRNWLAIAYRVGEQRHRGAAPDRPMR